MKIELVVKKEVFENDKGEKIPYTSYKAEICGQTFSFVPKAEDKKLLNYLLAQQEKESEPDLPDLASLESLGMPTERKK